jgi:hypothetical protein
MTIPIQPPFTRETALGKVRAAEDAWNSRDPARVSLAYSTDSIWRNRDRFVSGRGQIQEFLAGKWQRELDYRLVKDLWSRAPDGPEPLTRRGACRRRRLKRRDPTAACGSSPASPREVSMTESRD